METEDTRGPPRGKGIYLLPNLMTTGCLFSGFYAIIAAIDHHFAHAGMAVFVAMIFDTLDGRIAAVTAYRKQASQPNCRHSWPKSEMRATPH